MEGGEKSGLLLCGVEGVCEALLLCGVGVEEACGVVCEGCVEVWECGGEGGVEEAREVACNGGVEEACEEV